MTNLWNFPDLGLGLGLRPVHFNYILENWPAIDWFEILSENYMDTEGRPLYVLDLCASLPETDPASLMDAVNGWFREWTSEGLSSGAKLDA